MADVNLGTVYTQIDLDTSLLNQRVADVVEIWRNMQSSTEKVTTNLNRSMVDGVTKYQQKLDIIADKLERQRRIITQLQATSNKTVVGKNTEAEIAKATAQLESERIKLKELEAQFDSTYSSMSDFISKQDEIAEKAVEVEQKLELKQAGESAKEGTSLLTAGLRTLNEIAPDLGGNLDTLITQINAIRTAMSGGTPSVAQWATAITAGIGIVVTVVVAAINYFEDLREKQRQAFEEGVEKAQEYAQNIAALEANNRILNDASSSVGDLRAANDALASTFPDLVIGYDNEGNAIIANNEQRKERLEMMREEERLNRKVILKNADYTKEIEAQSNKLTNATEKLKVYEEYKKQGQTTIASSSYAGGSYSESVSEIDELINKQKQLIQEVKDWKTEFKTGEKMGGYEAAIQDAIKLADANGKMAVSYDYATNVQQAYITSLLRSSTYVDAYLSGQKTAAELAAEISDKASDPANIEAFIAEAQKQADLAYILTEQYGQQEATVADLSDAYQKLASGASLTKDELQKLAQTFPLIHEYLDQTGDRALKNGKILADAMGQIDYSNQIDELGDLATAYGRLSDGQQLSVQQLYDLAAAYPEVAEYLQKTGDYTLNNGEVLKDLFEIRKQVHIQQLEAARDEMEAAKKETQVVIDGIQKQIAAYAELAKVRGASLKSASGSQLDEGRAEQRYTKTIAEQKAYTEELEDQIAKAEQLQKDIDAANARIAAIKSAAANIDTFTGSKKSSSSGKKSGSKSSDRNEALAEELKRIDHLSKIEQMRDDEKLARLKTIKATYEQNADERMDLEYRIFSLQKQIQDAADQALTDQLNAEYAGIEQDKRMDQMTPDQELERLRQIQSQYMSDARDIQLTQEQQLDLSYRIHQAEKAVADEREKASQKLLDSVSQEFSHRAAMGENVAQAELDRLTEIQRKAEEAMNKEESLLTEGERVYRLTSEQKMDLDEKVYALRVKLAKEAEQAEKSRYDKELKRIQNRVSLGQYTTEDEIKQLEKLKRKYRKNKEIQMELEIKLYNLKRELHQQEVQAVDSLADAITEALRNRYEEQRKAEQDRINESIESWKKWEEETVDAIQGQIDALDELDKQQESEEKRREYERKKQALSLQIAYEKDDYQRKQYQQELARLEEEEQKRLDDEAREAKRKRLEEEMKKAQEESQKQQDALQEQLDKVNEEYDKRTEDFQLRAEAEKAIMENTQKEIVELIKAFAPEYNLAGQTIGEKLAEGFKNKFRDVLNYVESVTNQISKYQQTLIDQANAAADKFYQTQQNQTQLPQPPASLASAREAQPVQVTVNFNQPVESPVETRRAIESVMNEIARQIG